MSRLGPFRPAGLLQLLLGVSTRETSVRLCELCILACLLVWVKSCHPSYSFTTTEDGEKNPLLQNHSLPHSILTEDELGGTAAAAARSSGSHGCCCSFSSSSQPCQAPLLHTLKPSSSSSKSTKPTSCCCPPASRKIDRYAGSAPCCGSHALRQIGS